MKQDFDRRLSTLDSRLIEQKTRGIMKGTAPKAERATVTLTSNRQMVEARPALDALKQRLRTDACFSSDVGSGLVTARASMPLRHRGTGALSGEEPFLAYGAGLEPAICRIVKEAGYKLERMGLAPSPLPPPEQFVVAPNRRDDRLLRCV